jgi:hypothetical protein
MTCCPESMLSNPDEPQVRPHWIEAKVSSPVGPVPRVSTGLIWLDYLGTWKARWGFRRMHYQIKPGLYAVGNPDAESEVLVTANYKMSFDRLRSQLTGRNFWILVLDTRGINVWCAAGKGTFGTEELIRRLDAVRLTEVVSHRRLILPQLGAVGVSAHKVKQASDFRVIYGPVRAGDLPAFLDNGKKATPQMRQVNFPLLDRVSLIPMELVLSAKYVFLTALCLFLLSGLNRDGFSRMYWITSGISSVVFLLSAWLSGAVVGPALLPWLPGRAFAEKGAWIGGVVFTLIMAALRPLPGLFGNWMTLAAWLLISMTVASFLTMNFTGASTYTSLSGVRREMRIAIPLQLMGATAGLTLWITARFL